MGRNIAKRMKIEKFYDPPFSFPKLFKNFKVVQINVPSEKKKFPLVEQTKKNNKCVRKKFFFF